MFSTSNLSDFIKDLIESRKGDFFENIDMFYQFLGSNGFQDGRCEVSIICPFNEAHPPHMVANINGKLQIICNTESFPFTSSFVSSVYANTANNEDITLQLNGLTAVMEKNFARKEIIYTFSRKTPLSSYQSVSQKDIILDFLIRNGLQRFLRDNSPYIYDCIVSVLFPTEISPRSFPTMEIPGVGIFYTDGGFPFNESFFSLVLDSLEDNNFILSDGSKIYVGINPEEDCTVYNFCFHISNI